MNIARQIRNEAYDRKHPISHVGWVDPFAVKPPAPVEPAKEKPVDTDINLDNSAPIY